MARPSFIVSSADVPEKSDHYPNSSECLGHARALSRRAGLDLLGVNLVRLAPGERSSWPHAEADEEEFVYVIAGRADCWLDGDLHPVKSGDFIAFPKATGISHCFINNSQDDVLLLVGGEKSRPGSRAYYPLHPHRQHDPGVGPALWWTPPERALGPHDGLPDSLRKSQQQPEKARA